MKPLISLATLVVALGCLGGNAIHRRHHQDRVLNDMSGTYSDLSGRVR